MILATSCEVDFVPPPQTLFGYLTRDCEVVFCLAEEQSPPTSRALFSYHDQSFPQEVRSDSNYIYFLSSFRLLRF